MSEASPQDLRHALEQCRWELEQDAVRYQLLLHHLAAAARALEAADAESGEAALEAMAQAFAGYRPPRVTRGGTVTRRLAAAESHLPAPLRNRIVTLRAQSHAAHAAARPTAKEDEKATERGQR